MANRHDSDYHSHKDVVHQVVVVMLPLPAQGHLNQLLHLSRLISYHNIPIYYTGFTTHILQARSRVHGWDPSAIANICFHEFPTIPFDNPSPNPNKTQTKFPLHLIPSLTSSTHLREPFYAYVKKLSTTFRKVVVIYDSLMSYVAQDIDSIPNVDPYCFRSISAFTLYTFHWDAAGRPSVPHEAQVMNEVPLLDGCFPPEFTDFRVLQHNARKIFSGDIYNSNREIEGPFLDTLAKEKTTGSENIWALGPFNPMNVNVSNVNKEPSIPCDKCLEWLDKQEENSVIFVSFGTTSLISDEQIKEIAFGLEQSEQKFVWVLRDADKGDVFAGDLSRAQIPLGYEERVKRRGFIIRDWAPQLEILGHPATGGFMSHCGWNSCMESISMGVPIATWPMHSDQPSNAILVTKALKIGVEVKNWSRRDEMVSSFEVENAVRRLMASTEGDEIRKRAAEMRNRVGKSMTKDGHTCKEMDSFINQITS